MSTMTLHAFSSVGVALMLTAGTLAAPAEAIYPIAGHVPAGSSRADVPGNPGLQFLNFGRIYRSRNDRWITVPSLTSSPAPVGTNDQLVFAGVGRVGAALAREGETLVEDGLGTLLNLGGANIPRINDSGDWAYTFAVGGRAVAVKNVGGVFSTVAGGFDAATALNASAFWGNDFANANITNAGAVSFQANNVSDPTFSDVFSRLNLRDNGSTITARATQTIPEGQLQPGEPVAVSALSYSTTTLHSHVSADGLVTVYLADLGTVPPTRVVVRNNQVVLQVGGTIEGLTVNSISECWLEPSGQWFALASLAPAGGGGTTSVIREGAVIARVGQPIFAGSTENWTSITDYKGSTDEQFVVTGATSLADNASNQVAVLNAGQVIARSGDPVALDPDLVMNDNVFIHSFRDRTVLLSDALLVGTRLKASATGTSTLGANASLLRIAVTPRRCSPVDIANDQGEAIHNYSAIPNPVVPNNGLSEGDYNLFFSVFFDAGAPADIASDSGELLPPFGNGGTTTSPNNGVTEADYNVFFSLFFNGCPA